LALDGLCGGDKLGFGLCEGELELEPEFTETPLRFLQEPIKAPIPLIIDSATNPSKTIGVPTAVGAPHFVAVCLRELVVI